MSTYQRFCYLTRLVSVWLCCFSCHTPDKDGIDQPVQKMYYTLRKVEVKKPEPPWPAKTEIYRDWHLTNGQILSTMSYVVWKFDIQGSSRTLIEQFSDSGLVLSKAYDFDGDGIIDTFKNYKTGRRVSGQLAHQSFHRNLRQSQTPPDSMEVILAH